jgi:dienelactone hydrolase
MREAVVVESSGESLPGDLFLPEHRGDERVPAIVLCHATGSRRSTDFEMSQWFCDRGFAVLTFDWRGCIGDPSPRDLFPLRVAEDLRAGISYLQGRVDIATDKNGLLGRGLGGAFAVMAAAADARVAATICLSGFGDFSRRTALVLGIEAWQKIRTTDATTVNAAHLLGTHPAATPSPNSFEFSIDSVRALMACRPEDVVGAIAPRPLLIVHAADDAMFPRSEAVSLYAKASLDAELAFIDTSDHMEMYPGGHPRVYEATMARCDDFFRRHLRPTDAKVVGP